MNQAEAGKGSRPRPFSISQAEYDSRWDAIFARDIKEEIMSKTEQKKKGTCDCGRSPTGDCIGWHALTEDAFQKKLIDYNKKIASNVENK